MASNHPIDDLFREGTVNIEVTPGSGSWDQIQHQIGSKRRPIVIWRVAAAILILLSAGMVFRSYLRPSSDHQLATVPARVDSPDLPETAQLTIPDRAVAVIQTAGQGHPGAVTSSLPAPARSPVYHTPSQYTVISNLADLSPRGMESVRLVSGRIDIPALSLEDHPDHPINIIYYARATPGTQPASKGKIARIIDYARTSGPGDWVGDIRHKKDEWIGNVISLD